MNVVALQDEREHRHKLAAVAEGPYRVIEAKDTTVVIEKDDRSVERVSRSRVVLAPKPRTLDEVQRSVRPMTDEELIPEEYPVQEGINARDVTRRVNSREKEIIELDASEDEMTRAQPEKRHKTSNKTNGKDEVNRTEPLEESG